MFVPGEDENEEEDQWEPGPEVTPELFLEWRNARRGSFPGEVMSNPVWRWLIDSNLGAYRSNRHFNGPDSCEAGPGWSFNRFGRSLTLLPDGTRILIAGEHEDHYDADFFIYNDVVVVREDGHIEILAYPEDHFPPTDFHSATLAGDELILIGNLSYPGQRKFGQTQVFAFDIAARMFRRVATSGEMPGWISSHDAQLDPARNSILVSGGKIDHGPEHGGYLENFDTWCLSLTDWSWERLTKRVIRRWRFTREDGKVCHLFPKRLGSEKANKNLLDHLYDPLVDHEAVAEDAWSDRTRFVIEGVPLHFNEEMHSVTLTVEGDLPAELMDAYVNAVRKRLSTLEEAEYQVSRL